MKNIVFILLAISCMHCATARKGTPSITLQNNEETLSVKPNTAYIVEIPLQSGTGYTWEFDALSVKSKLLSRGTSTPGDTTLPGGTIHDVFTFKAPASFTEETLNFTLRRPWEKNGAPAQVRALRVKKL